MAKTESKAEFEVVDSMPQIRRGVDRAETVEDRVITALIASPDESGVIKLPTDDIEGTRKALRYAAFRQDRSAVTRPGDGCVFVSVKPRVVRGPNTNAAASA